MKFVLYFAIGWCVLLAVAGIALPGDDEWVVNRRAW